MLLLLDASSFRGVATSSSRILGATVGLRGLQCFRWNEKSSQARLAERAVLFRMLIRYTHWKRPAKGADPIADRMADPARPARFNSLISLCSGTYEPQLSDAERVISKCQVPTLSLSRIFLIMLCSTVEYMLCNLHVLLSIVPSFCLLTLIV